MPRLADTPGPAPRVSASDTTSRTAGPGVKQSTVSVAQNSAQVWSASVAGAAAERGADRFDTLAVDAEVGVPDARRRANLDGVGGAVEHAVDVVDEAKPAAGELGVQPGVVGRHHARAGHRLDDRPQPAHGLGAIAAVGERVDAMLGVGRLAGDAVG